MKLSLHEPLFTVGVLILGVVIPLVFAVVLILEVASR